jgi:hypothetical protein
LRRRRGWKSRFIPSSWDPSGSGSWTTGSDVGYWEGETAARVAEITNEAGQTYDLPICLQVWEEPGIVG